MKTIGIIRRFDDLGRIVIPKEIRQLLFGEAEKAEGMPMEIFMNGKDIVIRKYEANDVCEWVKHENTYNYKSYTHSEMFDSRVLDWSRCPYCGKKIKVVE